MYASATSEAWHVEVFYDGECPLCLREIRLLKRLDRKGHILFTDIALPEFDAAALGLSHAELMAKIHGRLRNGEFIQGVEVFRQLYSAVGWGALVWVSRAPGLAQLLDFAYRWFAANRLRLTGRCVAGTCSVPAREPHAPN